MFIRIYKAKYNYTEMSHRMLQFYNIIYSVTRNIS